MPPTPHLPPRLVPTHERLVAFFGVRLRLVVGIVLVGSAGGLFGAAYLWTLDRIEHVIGPEGWDEVTHLFMLVGAGILVTVLIKFLGPPAGVELLVDNIHIPGEGKGEVRLGSLNAISLVCIGAGGTLGPEAPLVTTTGTLAHRFAGKYGLDEEDVRVLMIAAMASGFAVLFGAPMGAALFALEIPHRRGMAYHEAVVPACIGAVLGFSFSTAAGRMGLTPIWDLPTVIELEWWDLGWSALAGLIGALIAAAFTISARVSLRVVNYVPPTFRPALGGLAMGAIALSTPYVLTNGEFQVEHLELVAAGTLAIALIAKFAGSVISVATGWVGGFIIPLMVMGYCAGRLLAPHLPAATDYAFITSVMIAANVGVTKTPLGTTLVVLEMAGMAVLPTGLVAALTSLVLTNPVAMIDAQRERVDAYGPTL